jgi:uncharacterized SAM-binding protein YcdF (DUF218 family)
MYALGKFLASLAFPPGLFALLILVSLLFLSLGKRKTGIAFAVATLLLTYGLSIFAVADLIVAPLEAKYPPISDAEGSAAIVVLGGGAMDHSPENGGQPVLTPESAARALYGFELSKRYGLPLVYSGGEDGNQGIAAKRLWLSLGVPEKKIILETKSYDTKTNASRVAEILKGGKVIVVTSAYHMPRSILSFRKAGMQPVAAPTMYLFKYFEPGLADFLPNTGALDKTTIALHEYVGLLYYSLILR